LREYPAVYKWLCDEVGDLTEQWIELQTTTSYIPGKSNG
jgi:hypothetical protein